MGVWRYSLPGNSGLMRSTYTPYPAMTSAASSARTSTASRPTAFSVRTFFTVFAIFDREEVGSGSENGGGSMFLPDVLERISASMGKNGAEHKRLLSRDRKMVVLPYHYTGQSEKSQDIVLRCLTFRDCRCIIKTMKSLWRHL